MTKKFRNISKWKDLVGQWKISGLSVKQFCQQEEVSETRFYEMRKLIKTSGNKPKKFSKPLFLPVQVSSETKILPTVISTPTPALLDLTLSNGCYLRFPSSINTQELIEITQALTK